MLSGILASSTIGCTSILAAKHVGLLSAASLSVITGFSIRNTVGLPSSFQKGVDYSSNTLLKAGIVCVGAKLSMAELLQSAADVVPYAATTVGCGLGGVLLVSKLAGLHKKQASLIAIGTSVCGVTAIGALSPSIKATSQQTAIAVATITMFGSMAMLAYPYVPWGDSIDVGMFFGLGIHDTAQVLGAAASYEQITGKEALETAALTKLTRNLSLLVAVPALTWYNASSQQSSSGGAKKFAWTNYLPYFVVGFLAMSLLRTAGDAHWGAHDERWSRVTHALGSTASTALLSTALAAVGLRTSVAAFRGVGVRPFLVGATAAVGVGALGYMMARKQEEEDSRPPSVTIKQ